VLLSTAAEKDKLLRKTVCCVPAALERTTFVGWLDVLPNATTVDVVTKLDDAVEVAISNVWIEPSVTFPFVYAFALPFKVTASVPLRGITNGVVFPNWN